MRYMCESCGEETWLRALKHYPGEPIDWITECCGGEDYVAASDCTMCGDFLPTTSLRRVELPHGAEALCARCLFDQEKGECIS